MDYGMMSYKPSRSVAGPRFHDVGYFRAAMAAAALTATADGVLAECELQRALAAINEQPRLRPFGRTAAESTFRSFADNILRQAGGVQNALDALDVIYGDEVAAASVLDLAVAVCESDGVVNGAEGAMLALLRNRLGLETPDGIDDGA